MKVTLNIGPTGVDPATFWDEYLQCYQLMKQKKFISQRSLQLRETIEIHDMAGYSSKLQETSVLVRCRRVNVVRVFRSVLPFFQRKTSRLRQVSVLWTRFRENYLRDLNETYTQHRSY